MYTDFAQAIRDFLSLSFNDYYILWFSDSGEIHTCVIDDHNDDKLPLKFGILIKILDKKFDFEHECIIEMSASELICTDQNGNQVIMSAYDNEIHHMNLVE